MSNPNLVKKIEKYFGMKFSDVAFIGIFVSIITVLFLYFVAAPFYQYQSADAAGKCAIDLKNKNDSDAFCDSNNKLQSKAEVAKKEAEKQTKLAEEARRAALTPKQKCEEDHKSGGDPDSGEYFYIFCKDDGTYEIKTADELQNEMESDTQEVQQEDNCDPNYSPCVPNVSYDLDCSDIGFSVKVIGTDVNNFDRDGDGYGCEPY